MKELKEFDIPELSDYDIVSYIGKGMWTPVFKAIRKTDGSEWALKFYRPNETGQQYAEEGGWTEDDYWQKESQNGKTPVHENIAYNFVDTADNGEKFLAEVYVGERFLHQYLEQKEILSLDEIMKISKGMASALEIQHTRAGGDGRAHGDFAPKNMGYDLDEIIKLSDFGTSTMSEHKVGNRGYPEIRAVEQFSSTQPPTKQGDVFSFGSTLYKLFTGKYIFEEELSDKFKDNPEAFMKYLAEDPKRWKRTIDDKLKEHDNIPKAFRKLLRKCLYDPEHRIENGEELKEELEKTVKKYHWSENAPVVYSLAGAAALIAAVSVWAGIGSFNDKLAQKDQEKEYEKKVRVVKLATGASVYHDTWEFLGSVKLDTWERILKEQGIKDANIIYAAFLNPDITFEAIQETGRLDYGGIQSYIYKADPALYNAIESIKGHYLDSWVRHSDTGSMFDKDIKQAWEQAQERYKSKLIREKEPPTQSQGLGYQINGKQKVIAEAERDMSNTWKNARQTFEVKQKAKLRELKK